MTSIFSNKVLRAGLQSGTIMSIADIMIQTMIEGRDSNKKDDQATAAIQNDTKQDKASATPTRVSSSSSSSTILSWDFERTIRWGIAGLFIHGPYFFMGFSQVDSYFAKLKPPHSPPPWKVVVGKTLIAQCILFPPYLVALFTYMGYMEGLGTYEKISEKVVDRVPKAFMTGCIYWPIANATNFAFISNTMRVPYLAVTAGIWNGYLSYMNSHSKNIEQQN